MWLSEVVCVMCGGLRCVVDRCVHCEWLFEFGCVFGLVSRCVLFVGVCVEARACHKLAEHCGCVFACGRV